jgi:pimeloyl-ACP methyl ester carboxylesterase
MTTSHVDVPGGRLLVVDDGEGPAIVLLHAGVADHRAWDALAPLLAVAGYRAVRYDARGFGESTTEDVEFSHRDDLRTVMDALGVGRAALVGNSLGGMLAFDTAIESPDRIVAVVGVGAGLGGFDPESGPDELAIFEEYERIDKAVPFDPAALTEFETKIWVDGPGQPTDRVDPAVRDLVYQMNLPLNQVGRTVGRAIRLEPPANARLGDLRCPVLAVAGMLDFSEVVQTAQHLEAKAPQARALIWPGVAHMIGMEEPRRLASAISDFLAPLDRWS